MVHQTSQYMTWVWDGLVIRELFRIRDTKVMTSYHSDSNNLANDSSPHSDKDQVHFIISSNFDLNFLITVEALVNDHLWKSKALS